MKQTLIERFTSRKFLLTLGVVLGAVSGGLTGALTWPQAINAIVLAIIPFVFGQSYIEGQAAKFVPPEAQKDLVINLAQGMINKKLNELNRVTPTSTFTTSTATDGEFVVEDFVKGGAINERGGDSE